MTVTTAEAAQSRPRLWRDHLLALGLIIFLIAAEFHDALYAAFQVWRVSPTYSHCFLIIPIVGWLIWEKREALRIIRPRADPRFLLLVPLLLAIWWLGELSTINEVRQFAIVGLIQAAIIAFLGIEVVRIIWFPILFLLFLVPTGEYLIAPMQRFATHFVDVSLRLLNIPHYTEGSVIELTNGRFEIAEACAGLRFLVATVTLGVLFCYLMYRNPYKIILFLVASVAVPLIGNGLRCVGIILLAHFTNNEFGAGADHLIYGWGFNIAILLVLGLVGSFFRDDSPGATFVASRPHLREKPFSLTIMSVIAAVLISAGPAFGWWRDTRPASPDLTSIANYLHTGGWIEHAEGNWTPHFTGADTSLGMSRSDGSSAPPIHLFIAYYARPRAGHNMTAHLNQAWDDRVWNKSFGDTATAPLGGHVIGLQESLINSGFEKRLVWSFYWVDSDFTSRPLVVKVRQVKAMLEGREGQAFIVLATTVDGPMQEARARLGNTLGGLGALSAQLGKADVSGPQRGLP